MLEIRNLSGRLYVARKQRRHDEWHPSVEPYGPYAPGKGYDVIIDEGDASPDAGDASPVEVVTHHPEKVSITRCRRTNGTPCGSGKGLLPSSIFPACEDGGLHSAQCGKSLSQTGRLV